MVILDKTIRLAYFPIPKVANTTIKAAMREICRNGGTYQDQGNNRMTFWHRYQARNCVRLAVIRDPLDRVVSAYRNRIVHHGDIRRSGFSQWVLDRLGLSREPSLNEFVLNLRSYQLGNERLLRHTLPQVWYIGKNLSFFDHVFTIRELKQLEQTLNGLFNTSVEFGHLKTGGPKLTVNDLSAEARRVAEAYYSVDYQILGARLADERRDTPRGMQAA